MTNTGDLLKMAGNAPGGDAIVPRGVRGAGARGGAEFSALFDMIAEGVALFDLNGRVVDANPAFCERLGYPREEMAGMCISRLSRPGHAAQMLRQLMEARTYGAAVFEAAFAHKSGAALPSRISGKLIRLDGADFILSVAAGWGPGDSGLEHRDPLTGLPNRRMLFERLGRCLAASRSSGRFGALLYLNLDNFKTVNNIRGHDAGDSLLQQVARRLLASLREQDAVARIGGDEFGVILEDLDVVREQAAERARVAADTLLSELSRPYDVGGNECAGSASIGIALFGGVEEDANELFKRADMAMNEAKKAGRGTFRFFDRGMQADIEQKAQINTGMRAALKAGHFLPYYQKLVNSEGSVQGAEVLARWHDPDYGLIPPARFIPLAEESGLIVSIGDIMLEAACRQLKEWRAQESTRDLALSVNIASREFKQPDFVARVRRIVETAGADPALLVLEITETVLLDNMDDTVAKMKALRAIGISFALDDFGTGYSSLSYLKKLPLNRIKIDRSFINDLGVGQSDTAIVHTIVQMGKALGLEVVAEGVETELQRSLLVELGCHRFQGYLFGEPAPIEVFEREIRGRSRHPT